MNTTRTALKVKLAKELQAELFRWTDLPDSKRDATDTVCWSFITGTNVSTCDLLKKLEAIPEEYYWLDYSTRLTEADPTSEHRRQNREDCKARFRELVSRHFRALKAARSLGVLC